MKQSIGAKALIAPIPVWVVGIDGHENKPNMWNEFDFIFSDKIYRITGILFAYGDMLLAEGSSIPRIRLVLSHCFSKIRIHSLVTFGIPRAPNPSWDIPR